VSAPSELSSSLISTLPGHFYTDPVIFSEEQEKIFESRWFAAARSSEIDGPGAFRTVAIGRENVARNWSWVFEQFEDFEAHLRDVALRDDTAWTEWAWSGTDPSGMRIEVRGIMIFQIEDGMFRHGRLYLEPVSSVLD
jgi:hypothetical protein